MCEFRKSPTHNTSECRAKKSLVVEHKASESYACSNSQSEIHKGNEKGKQIINVEPSAIIATTKIQQDELKDLEEGERLFHSQMWVKGSMLQFIVDSISQKNSSRLATNARATKIIVLGFLVLVLEDQ